MEKNWDDISIGQFEEILRLTKDKELTDDERMVGIIAVAFKVTEDEIMTQPLARTMEMTRAVEPLKGKPREVKAKDRYIINGQKYNVASKPERITTAQYIDYQSYAKDAENHLAEILSLVLIPDGKTYGDGYDVAMVIDDIRAFFPVCDALALSKVFRCRWLKSIRRSLLFSEAIVRGMETTETRTETRKAIEALRAMRKEITAML